ncbi:MAG: hypothetical protein WC494_00145 [Candidatus Pacearchaeota archaeon]
MAEKVDFTKQEVMYENEGGVNDEIVKKPVEEPLKKINLPSKESPKKTGEKQIPPKPSEQNNNESNIEKSMNPEQNKKIHYRFAGHESLLEMIKKTLPKEFFPSKRLELIFGIVFLAIIFLGLIRFPLHSLLAGDTSAAITIGFPFFNFLVFDMIEPENFPLKIPALIFDMIFFLIIAYAIDIIMNFVHYRAKSLTKEERGKRPKILKIDKKESLSDKFTKKLFGEE